MRIPSGVTDQYIYFVAVDDTDLKTRETGLSSFTVYRSRNGGVATAYTTPTINETSSANMPGVYELLLDEDMTIDSGDKSQEVCLHITATGMAPVTRIFELYRPDVSAGETITASSGAVSTVTTTTNVTTVNGLANNVITAASIATGAFTAAKFAANALDAVWSTATRLLTAGTNIVLAKGTGVTGFNDLDAAGVRTAVGLASANLDTQLSTIDSNVDSILVDTGTTLDGKIDLIDSNLDALIADIGVGGAGLTDIPWNSSWDVEVESEVTDALTTYDAATGTDVSGLNNLSQADIRSAVGMATANLDTQLSDIDTAISGITAPSAADIADAVWDEAIAGHNTVGSTGEALADASGVGTPPTVDEIADEIETRTINANIVQVNNVLVEGSGTEENPWGP